MDDSEVDDRLAQLTVALDELVVLLRDHGETHWSRWAERCRSELARFDAVALDHLLGAYGGMGSFSDLIILAVNGHDVRPEEEAAVNDRLDALRRQVHEQASALRTGPREPSPGPDRSRRAPADSPRWTSRSKAALVPAVLALFFLAVTANAGLEASTRLRVDTPVEAVLEGEPGCITNGRYTVDDRTYTVDLRRYKANCIDGTPGGTTTVWYDDSDPSVAAPSRSWSLWLVPLLGGGALALLGLRAAVRALRGHEPPRQEVFGGR